MCAAPCLGVGNVSLHQASASGFPPSCFHSLNEHPILPYTYIISFLTLMPPAASLSATPRPRPVEAPITTATFPLTSCKSAQQLPLSKGRGIRNVNPQQTTAKQVILFSTSGKSKQKACLGRCCHTCQRQPVFCSKSLFFVTA